MDTSKSKKEYYFFNDEWNSNKINNDNPLVNSKDEDKIKTFKNDKPDGRRYKK